jgi:hypothetical protein
MAFPILLALLPLGAYLVMMGSLRMLGRPLVTTGGRDIFALSVGISGLAAVGPGELFFPSAAGATFGPAVWPLLALFYFLLVVMVILNSRPRLVVYGVSGQILAQPLLRACQRLDPQSVVDGSAGTVTLPSHAIHLRIKPHGMSDSADIEAFEANVTPMFWRLLLAELRKEVALLPTTAPASGGLVTVVGLAMLLLVALQVVRAPRQLVEGLRDWLWR